ncbi:MAG: hypothetical protein IKP10_08290 [Clostridia bacterium]|nr:hypothetical protein [Clostridia bacterium]
MLRAAREAAVELMRGIPAARRPALRRANEAGWMLATDLPLIADEAGREHFLTLAREAGWRTGRTPGGWVLLDRLDLLPQAPPPDRLPDGEAGALISLLARHPSDGTDDEALRAIAAAAEQGRPQLDRLCAALHAAWARALRRHEKIPGALMPYLCAAVRETEE